MAIGYRASSSATGSGAASLNPAKPTGTVDNDVMWALVGVNTSAVTITMSGWTSLGSVTHPDAPNFKAELFRKVASGEGASYTVSFSSNTDASVTIDTLSGVDTTTPLDATITTNAATDTAPIGLAVSPVTANAWLLFGCVANTNGTAITEPSGFTERVEVATVRNHQSDAIQVSPGSSGNKTGSLGASRNWIVFLAAIRPAGAAAAASVPHRRRPYRFFTRRG